MCPRLRLLAGDKAAFAEAVVRLSGEVRGAVCYMYRREGRMGKGRAAFGEAVAGHTVSLISCPCSVLCLFAAGGQPAASPTLTSHAHTPQFDFRELSGRDLEVFKMFV